MSTLPEQFSAVSKSQLEAQLAFFQDVTAKAVAGTEKLIALNLSTARASLEKSSDTVRQLFTVKDPRDLFTLTTHTQQNFDTLLAWGRELFTIASSTQAALLKPGAAFAQAAPVPAITPVALAAPVAHPEPLAPAHVEVEVLADANANADQLDILTQRPRKKK